MARFIPNSTMIPNAFIDEAMNMLSDKALRLYLIVARKTTGWGKESDCISISQFMALSGLKDERTVRAGAKELVERGLIATLKTQGQPTRFYLVGNVAGDVPPTSDAPTTYHAPPTSDAPTPLHDMQGVPPTSDAPHKINIKTTNTKTKTSMCKSTKSGDEYSEDFEKFWEAYPKKKSKGDAMKAWTKLNPDEQLQQKIISAVFLAKTQDFDWLKDGGQYIPHAATYLNGKRWEDEVITQAQKSPGDMSGQNRGNSSNNVGDYTARKNVYVSKQQQRQNIGAEIFGSAELSYSKRHGASGYAVCQDVGDLLDALDGQFYIVPTSENVKV